MRALGTLREKAHENFLDDIQIFVKVAEFESITRAARSWGLPISTASRRLSVLESELAAVIPTDEKSALIFVG
jgi:hypothetical protein